MTDAVVRILAFTALAGLAFLPLERLYGHRHRGPRRDRLTDLGFATVGELGVHAGLAVIIGGLLSWVHDVGLDRPLWAVIGHRGVRGVVEVASGLLLFELAGYAYHRLAHAVPWMWRLHTVHHSAERMDWLASFRQHPLEILLVTFVQNAPLVLLGIPLGAHAMVLLLLRINTVFVHADLDVGGGPGWRTGGRWSWLRWVIATPHFHHRHHDRDAAPRNFAAMFPWIDRVMGTHDASPARRVGLPGSPLPRSFVGLLVAPFVPALHRSAAVTPAADRGGARAGSP